MSGKRLISLTLVILLLIAVVPVQSNAEQHSQIAQRLPSFVRLSLAGAKLLDEDSYIKYDPKEGYYLVATGDCDGASIVLVLSPNPKEYGYDPASATAEEKRSLKRVILPRLRTGTGVNIGDSPQEVLRKLGTRPCYTSFDRTAKRRRWIYRKTLMVKERRERGLQNYVATYEFRNEKLWSIVYNIHSVHGCGE